MRRYRAFVPYVRQLPKRARGSDNFTLPDNYCRWCGDTFPPCDGKLYCSKNHRFAANRARAARNAPGVCPHPEKLKLPDRGTALLWARQKHARAYLCRCGHYHLTHQQPRRAEQT